MALKILLADDSVPAQNMGKKILTEAGYEVLTVSNGLEALRKISESAPDIAILDIFMPGYTGLEICERLRASAPTAGLPVILTVGKLEPYRPEDGAHVRSNAVIVKPFAAAELISAVRSLIGVRPAEVHCAPKVEDLPAPVAEPPQEDLAPTANAEPPATPWHLADVSPKEVAHELVFSGVESTAARNAEALPSRADEEPLGAESLVFNPAAARTPFSASAAENTPAESLFPAKAAPSVSTEFELEPESPYFAKPSQVALALDTWHPTPDTASPHEAAVEPAVATNVAGKESTESEEAVCVAAAPAELESSSRNVPAIEPWEEALAGAASGGLEASRAAAGEANIPVVTASIGDAAFTSTIAQLAHDERARSLAFEELFNSTVTVAEEEDSAPHQAPAMVAPSSPTETYTQEPSGIEAAPEIVIDDHQDRLIAQAAEAERMEEYQPVRAIEPIFEGEQPLADTSSENWPSSGSVQPAEALASAVEESDPLLPEMAVDSMPHYNAVAPNAVAHEETPEIPSAEAAAVESEPLPPVASPERSYLVAEVAKVEALLVQMQAARQAAEEETGATLNGTEFQPSEAAEYPSQPFANAAQPETAPVHAPDETQVEIAAGPAQIEAELPPSEDVPVQSELEAEPEPVASLTEMMPVEPVLPEVEPWLEETSCASAQRLDEAERIHQAVEKVFDRFRPLLVAAIVRELARLD